MLLLLFLLLPLFWCSSFPILSLFNFHGICIFFYYVFVGLFCQNILFFFVVVCSFRCVAAIFSVVVVAARSLCLNFSSFSFRAAAFCSHFKYINLFLFFLSRVHLPEHILLNSFFGGFYFWLLLLLLFTCQSSGVEKVEIYYLHCNGFSLVMKIQSRVKKTRRIF